MRSYHKVLINFLGKDIKRKDMKMYFVRFGARRLTSTLPGLSPRRANGKVEKAWVFPFKVIH